MDGGALLLLLAVAVLAARAAAELADRVRQPAVLFEIAAGVLLGPSVLGVLQGEEVIRALGELGAVLLLFEVGLHMDLRELRRVGRAAMQVAVIGVVVPMVLGYPLLRALGVSPRVSIFLAAGITATSVGITARVFGDLRALATPAARTVLGAAVADDVAGLVILAIVIGAATEQGVALSSLAGTISLALGFLVAATVLGIWLVPRLIDRLDRSSRTDGTPVILALVVAFTLAGIAAVVKLAPVVGAFVAGLAVGPSARRDEIQRRLQPIGHLLIPLFFLQIGVDIQGRSFTEPRVLGIAAALAAVAVVGKAVAGLGVKRGVADRLLVGLAMIPRGEVGLIFATIGLSAGILDGPAHSILVVVVLISTVVTPPMIRWRVRRASRVAAVAAAAVEEPMGGWLSTTPQEIDLVAEPPPSLAAVIGLDVAIACASRRPGEKLLTWLSQATAGEAGENGRVTDGVFRLLREGTVRSWRFLEVSGLLARVLPEIDDAISRRGHDPFDLEPGSALRWETLEGLNALAPDVLDPASELWVGFESADLVRLAALARDAFAGDDDAGDRTRRLASRLGLDDADAALVEALVTERHLLPAAARRSDAGSEDSVLQIAAYLAYEWLADSLYVLAVAEDAMDPTDRERLDELHGIIRKVLAHPDVAGAEGGDVLMQRKSEAQKTLGNLLPERLVRSHLDEAPARYLLAQTPESIARHLRLIETKPIHFEVRLHADAETQPEEWTVHLAFLDRPGALAAVAGGLTSCGVSVHEAFVSTWRNGIAIDVFKVVAPSDIDWDGVRGAISARLQQPGSNGGPGPVDGSVDIDNDASPWHTIVEVRAPDRSGLLHRVASALARAGAEIHLANVTTVDGEAIDTFAVTGSTGAKLDDDGIRALRLSFAGKAPLRWRGPRLRRVKVARR